MSNTHSHSRSSSRSRRGKTSKYRKSQSRHSRDNYYDANSRSASRHQFSPSPGSTKRSRRYSSDSNSSSSRSYPSSNPRQERRRMSPRSQHSRTRTRSRSPLDSKRRADANRIKPTQSRCLGVFGLSVYTTQQRIREIFDKFGSIERIQVVIDAQTGRSRGFCFIYYDNTTDAKVAKENCSGLEVDGRRIRVDYSITQRPHTPTPGVYMGRPTKGYRERDRERDHPERYRNDHRSSRRHTPSYSPPAYCRHHRRCERGRSRYYEHGKSRSCSPRRSRY